MQEDNHSDHSYPDSELAEDTIFFNPALDVGSKFMTCSTGGDENEDAHYKDIHFYRDSKSRLIGSFWIHSWVKGKSKSIVAFRVETAATIVPITIVPNCGFIKPGEKKLVGILWPETHDARLISQTSFFIKSLPVANFFFTEYEPLMTEPESYKFNDDLLDKMFNPQNCRILFTMHSFGSSLPESNYFHPPAHIHDQMQCAFTCFDSHSKPIAPMNQNLTAH